MRHRRRRNTQTLQRQKYTTKISSVPAKKKRNLLKYLAYFILIAAIAYGGYYVINSNMLSFDIGGAASTSTPQGTTDPQETSVQSTEISAAETDNEQPDFPVPPRKTQVEVLNACGEEGIAARLSEILRSQNYDVVNSGNYLKNGEVYFDEPHTHIIDQLDTQDNFERAMDMAQLLGVDKQYVESFDNPSPIADITLIIGNDFKQIRLIE